VKILVTGAAGFIAGYLVEELLGAGHKVVGLDNYSKYGPVEHAYDTNPHYRGVTGDAKDVGLVKELLADCDQFVAGAAIIGGISLFHELAYDLIAESERITARRLRRGHRRPPQGAAPKNHRRLIVDGLREHERLSNSREQRRCPPPRSTYGFQKLATEYFAQGAHEQYGLPYTMSGRSTASASARSGPCPTRK
jgi:nucleoside-diphosphate-sugar epimerase